MGDVLSFPKVQKTKNPEKQTIDKEGVPVRADAEVLAFFQNILWMMQDHELDSVRITLPDIAVMNGRSVDTEFLVVLMGVGDVVFNKEVEDDATS